MQTGPNSGLLLTVSLGGGAGLERVQTEPSFSYGLGRGVGLDGSVLEVVWW